MAFNLGEYYFHVACYEKKTGAALEIDSKIAGAAYGRRGGETVDGMKRSISVPEDQKRKALQKIISDSVLWSSGFSLLLFAFFTWGIANAGTVKFDIAGWIAYGLFSLFGIWGVFVTSKYWLRLREHERLILSGE
jgi:hypothetical protein